MSNALPIDIGALERWGRLMLRPTMYVTYAGPRITEEVAIWYSSSDGGGYFGTGTTASVIVPTKRQGTARYVRAWVHNLFGFPAHRCQVFVDRIWHDGKIIEPERTPLHWTDLDDCFELPLIRKGYDNGHYIDICATDSVMKKLQIISQKSKKGYHFFNESGTYKLDMTAEALKPCSFSHFSLTVKFDATNWKGLQVVSAEHGKRLLRWI
jgi:hypothetical protein